MRLNSCHKLGRGERLNNIIVRTKTEARNFVYFFSFCGNENNGCVLCFSDFFANIKAVLSEVGLTTENIVKTTVFLADMSLFADMNEVYGTQFSGTFPSRSAFAVKTLPKNALVEIEVVAAK